MVKVFKISHFRQVLNFVQLSNPRGHLLGTFLSISRHSTSFELILLIFYFYYIILTVLVMCYTTTGSSNSSNPSDFYKQGHNRYDAKNVSLRKQIESYPLIKQIRIVKIFKISHFRQAPTFFQLSKPRGQCSFHQSTFYIFLNIFY